MIKYLFSLCFVLFSLTSISAKDGGYQIKVKIDGFQEKEVFLGYHYGDKQYIKDTVAVDSKGYFTFEGDEPLEGGVYLIIMPPDNQYIQLMINEGDQHFNLETTADNPVGNAKVKGSPDNEAFYEYMSFLSKQRPKAEKLNEGIKAAEGNPAEKEKLTKRLTNLNEEVKKYQKDLLTKFPNFLTSAIVQASFEVPLPEFKGTEDEVKLQRYSYYKEHYFDNIKMGDSRLLRSPVLFNRIDYYINKLTPQHPDSINLSIDRILNLVKPSEETFKYYLIHFLNVYAKSKIVGMDAVYVHIADTYYATGMAPWTEEEQLEKIVDNANTLRAILIGKIAPDVKMKILDIEGSIKLKDNENEHQRHKSLGPLSLHEVESPYTVLFMWDPDCGHCKKSMPKMLEFYDKYKPKGVEVFAVCTKTYKDIPECAETIKEKNMIKWINVYDPYIQSKYKTLYDVRSTPQVYILDEKKEIISKRIGAEQIDEVMEQILKMDEEKKK